MSASPSADASAEPSAEPSKEPSKATEIVIKDKVALTELDAATKKKHIHAYVAYDVLDQYGESVRDSVSITWTSSAGTVKADKSTGLLKVSKDMSSDEFMYGSLLYLVGVDTTHGLSVQAQVTIGMERAVDSIDFNGFVSKDAKSKKTDIQETLPVNFAKKTWMLLYTAKDQNGNIIEASGSRKTDGELNFLSNNPMLVTMEMKDAGIITIEGTDYDAIWVQPGMYVDKGGEVTISAISNKTGNSKNQVYTIGAGGLLKSIVLSQPKDVVADGDTDVEIPYKATDVNGNDVTDYETIVRSTNTLTVSAGTGTLNVVENNDGSAKFVWSDDTSSGKYKTDEAAFYQDGQAQNIHDGIDRPVALTTIVVGGESNNFMLQVSDGRIPAAIDAVSANGLDTDAFVTGDTGKIEIVGGTGHNCITYKDQYGKSLKQGKAKTFFEATKPGSGTYENCHYGIKTKISATNQLNLTSDIYYADTAYTDYDFDVISAANHGVIAITAGTQATNSLTLSVAKVKASVSSPAYDDWDVEGKKVTKTYETDGMSAVKNIELADFGTVGVVTNLTAKENGVEITDANIEKYAADANTPGVYNSASGAALTIEHGKNAQKVSVTGTLKGMKVVVPTAYLRDASSDNGVDAYAELAADRKTVEKVGNLKWNQLYDANSAKYVRKNASVKVMINVYDSVAGATAASASALKATPSKTLTVSDAPEAVGSVKLLKGSYGGPLDGAYLNPTGMHLENGATWNTASKVNTTVCNNFAWVDGDYIGAYSRDKSAASAKEQDATRYDVTGSIYLLVKSQYGDLIQNGNANVVGTALDGHLVKNWRAVFTVSDVVENKGALSHKADSFTISKNDSDELDITGAELGDTFTVTACVEGYESIKAVAKVTVGADTMSKISSATASDTDKNFRTKDDYLGAYDH